MYSAGNIANSGDVQGLAGIVTDEHARDYGESSKLPAWAFFCRGPTVRLPNDIEIVAQDAPITCGGAQVNPGDLIVADIDGVFVNPVFEDRAGTASKLRKILELEAEIGKVISKAGPVADIQSVVLKKKKTRKSSVV